MPLSDVLLSISGSGKVTPNARYHAEKKENSDCNLPRYLGCSKLRKNRVLTRTKVPADASFKVRTQCSFSPNVFFKTLAWRFNPVGGWRLGEDFDRQVSAVEKSCGTSGHVEPAVLCSGGGSVGRKTAEISGFERNNITSVHRWHAMMLEEQWCENRWFLRIKPTS